MPNRTAPPPSIPALKLAFLRAQIVQLSQPLVPSHSFVTSTPPDDALKQKTIDDVLLKVNGLLKRHNKLVYPALRMRHVAEQIGRLKVGSDMDAVGGIGLGKQEDYAKSETIQRLPDVADLDAGGASGDGQEEKEKYEELRGRLLQSDESRERARVRVARARALKGLLDGFGDSMRVQDGLVGRNGALEGELERMRMVGVRVERGLRGLVGLEKQSSGEAGGEEGEMESVGRRIEDLYQDAEGEGGEMKTLLALLAGDGWVANEVEYRISESRRS